MTDIAGFPYVEATFDEQGAQQTAVALPAGVTDLIVISHGWNNDAEDARALYRAFFTSLAAVGRPGDLAGRSIAVVGVFWPSKKFDELVAASGDPEGAQGAASLDADEASSLKVVAEKIERMKTVFTRPAQIATLDAAKALLPDLEEKASARTAFVDKIRSLLDRSAAGKDDASDSFFKDDGNELMKNLKVDEDDLDEDLTASGGSAALPLGVGTTHPVEGGAAGFRDVLSGFAASALNVLNYTTYYLMKTRAGTVGKNGVAKLVDTLAPQVQRVHLIGHSFGGRVAAAAAANSTTDKLRSLTLLQAAFSHNGFSKSMDGFFRSVVDAGRVHGPIVITHTKNDRAVGVAYPLASRINGDKAAKFGDEHDVFGGLGRNGAQQMQPGETIIGSLLAASGSYAFQPGKCHNLEASAFITGHSDITGKEVAHAVRSAIA